MGPGSPLLTFQSLQCVLLAMVTTLYKRLWDEFCFSSTPILESFWRVGVTVNSLAHSIIASVKASTIKSSSVFCMKPRFFFHKHPVMLFVVLYFTLLFVGSAILSVSVDITPADIANRTTPVENQTLWGWDKAFYFSWTTLTTIGYGDEIQESPLGRIFTCLYGLLGFSWLGIIFHRSTKFFNAYFPVLETKDVMWELDLMDISIEAKKAFLVIQKTVDGIQDPIERDIVVKALKHETRYSQLRTAIPDNEEEEDITVAETAL